MLYGIADIRSVSALPLARYYQYMHALSQSAEFTIQTTAVTESPLLDLAAVRYLVLALPYAYRGLDVKILTARPRPAKDDPDMPVVYSDGRVMVFENRAVQPRIRIVHEVSAVESQKAAYSSIALAAKRGRHAHEVGLAEKIVLEPDESGRQGPAVSGRVTPEEGVRLIHGSDPDRLSIEATLNSPGYVVIADSYHPGWRAWLDGRPATIHPANLLFQAVYVPAGDHSLELRYEPAGFTYGVWCCLASAMLCLYLLVRRRPQVRDAGPSLLPR
jgi:hypothetical protein